MKIKYLKRTIALLALMVIAFPMCKTRDLRTEVIKKQGITAENTAKGKAILKQALDAMNYEAWAKYPTYEVIGSDTWYKQWGMKLSPWQGEGNETLRLRYALNTFDSQVEWLDGNLKGQILGIQSWQLYRKNTDGQYEKIKEDKKLNFILPTMQYFNELLYRLYNAPILSYAGEKMENGITYDIVFTTWDSPEPNQHDQYLLYINRQTHRLEKTSYTIRDNFMWTPKGFYGTAVYSDFRQVDSVWIPFKMDVYPFGQTEKMKVHTFQVKEWHFNLFSLDSLYPLSDLKRVGDAKY